MTSACRSVPLPPSLLPEEGDEDPAGSDFMPLTSLVLLSASGAASEGGGAIMAATSENGGVAVFSWPEMKLLDKHYVTGE